jgi:hypothetical protein
VSDPIPFLTCAQAARQCPQSPTPNPATIWRWARKGVKARNGKRVCLEHVRAGAKVLIPEGALTTFFKAIADADSEYFRAAADAAPPPEPKWHPNCRQKAIADAEAMLNHAGI